MKLVICRDRSPRVPYEYVLNPRTSSLLRLQQFLRWLARQ